MRALHFIKVSYCVKRANEIQSDKIKIPCSAVTAVYPTGIVIKEVYTSYLTFRRLIQEDGELGVSLGCEERPYLKKTAEREKVV